MKRRKNDSFGSLLFTSALLYGIFHAYNSISNWFIKFLLFIMFAYLLFIVLMIFLGIDLIILLFKGLSNKK